MRMRIGVALLFVALTGLQGDDDVSPSKTLVADALDWYSLWHGKAASTPGVQTCRGELRDGIYQFRCDPLAVVVGALFDDSGRCYVVFMGPSIGAEDGLRVQTLRHLVPSEPDATPRQECGELPIGDGPFEIVVRPRRRAADPALTASARSAALAYIRRGGGSSCTFRFPVVKAGDPFVHVYERCQESLDAVWEFSVQHGEVADFAHWTYTRRRDNLPTGAEWRWAQDDLWAGISQPAER